MSNPVTFGDCLDLICLPENGIDKQYPINQNHSVINLGFVGEGEQDEVLCEKIIKDAYESPGTIFYGLDIQKVPDIEIPSNVIPIKGEYFSALLNFKSDSIDRIEAHYFVQCFKNEYVLAIIQASLTILKVGGELVMSGPSGSLYGLEQTLEKSGIEYSERSIKIGEETYWNQRIESTNVLVFTKTQESVSTSELVLFSRAITELLELENSMTTFDATKITNKTTRFYLRKLRGLLDYY